jgi:hypothetical protein
VNYRRVGRTQGGRSRPFFGASVRTWSSARSRQAFNAASRAGGRRAVLANLVQEVLSKHGVLDGDPFRVELANRLAKDGKRRTRDLRLSDLTWSASGSA